MSHKDNDMNTPTIADYVCYSIAVAFLALVMCGLSCRAAR
jgi:hypothetical protein